MLFLLPDQAIDIYSATGDQLDQQYYGEVKYTLCIVHVVMYCGLRRYVDQGGGKRKGAFAIYIEPWHADIFDFLDLRKNHGKEEVLSDSHSACPIIFPS